jgi:hypothetical protein
MADIDGDAGPNVLFDTPDNDTINGLDGDDTITVTEGNDSANGGNDFDTLIVSYGGAIADISGGFTNAIYGGRRHPECWVLAGFERIVITTGSRDDSIGTDVFSNGNDVLISGPATIVPIPASATTRRTAVPATTISTSAPATIPPLAAPTRIASRRTCRRQSRRSSGSFEQFLFRRDRQLHQFRIFRHRQHRQRQ